MLLRGNCCQISKTATIIFLFISIFLCVAAAHITDQTVLVHVCYLCRGVGWGIPNKVFPKNGLGMGVTQASPGMRLFSSRKGPKGAGSPAFNPLPHTEPHKHFVWCRGRNELVPTILMFKPPNPPTTPPQHHHHHHHLPPPLNFVLLHCWELNRSGSITHDL